MFVLRNKLRKEKYNGRFFAIGPVISKAVQDVVGSYTTSVTFDSIAGKIPTAGK